jgi:4-hydroxybenzoate polyprenyltransferase
VKKLLLRIGDFVFVMRPLILVPAWSVYLLGAEAGRRTAGASPGPLEGANGTPAPFYHGFACLTAILVTAYLLNQIFDQESDRLNRKGHFLTRGILSVRTVVVMALIVFLFATYFFRFVQPAQRLPLTSAVILSLGYSIPPLRLVARPFVDLLSNAVGYGAIAFVAGFAAWDPTVADGALLAIPYVFLVAATFLHTTIMDFEGDKISGKNTTSVAIGIVPSAVLACVFSAMGLAAAIALSLPHYGDKLSPFILGASTAVFIYGAVNLRRSVTRGPSSNAVQAVTLMVTVPAAVAWPGYLFLLVPVVAAARLYYRARFGIQYPGPAAMGGAEGRPPETGRV